MATKNGTSGGSIIQREKDKPKSKCKKWPNCSKRSWYIKSLCKEKSKSQYYKTSKSTDKHDNIALYKVSKLVNC